MEGMRREGWVPAIGGKIMARRARRMSVEQHMAAMNVR